MVVVLGLWLFVCRYHQRFFPLQLDFVSARTEPGLFDLLGPRLELYPEGGREIAVSQLATARRDKLPEEPELQKPPGEVRRPGFAPFLDGRLRQQEGGS